MRLTWRTFPRFYWQQFLTGFCFHLLLPAALLLLVGLVTGWIGWAFGLFHLVWHETALKQAVVGFALVFLAWEIALVGYLLESRRTPYEERFRLGIAGPAVCYLVGLVLSGMLTVGVVLLLRLLGQWILPGGAPEADVVLTPVDVRWSPPHGGLPLILGALIAGLFCLYLTTLHFLEPRVKPPLEWLGKKVFVVFQKLRFLGVKPPDDHDLFLHGVATFSTIVSIGFFTAVALWPQGFSPVVGAGFLLHLVVGIYAFLAYFLPRFVPVILFVGVGLVWLSGLPVYKQRFPALEPYYDNPVSLSGGEEKRPEPQPRLLPPDAIAFSVPARGQHAARTRRPLVLVCVSGGGLRSAAWTLAVLQRLEQQLAVEGIEFPYHVRVITGASGGMMGASAYVASLPEPGTKRAAGADRELWENLTQDSLSPVIYQMAYGDLWSPFWAKARKKDRGQALELAWRENLKGLLDVSFADLRDGEEKGWRPSLVFSPMLVEDGRRLLISNLDLQDLTQNTAPLLTKSESDLLSIGGFELFRLFPDPQTRGRFSLATASRMSASFPYVSPAAILPTRPRRRVVDAGYYDNYGVSLAASWLLSPANRDWLRDNVSGVLLIQVRDALAETERLLEGVPRDPSRPVTRGLEWISSPPEGLFTARESASAFRNDEQVEALGRLLTEEVQVRPLLARLTTAQIDLLREAAGAGRWPRPADLSLDSAWGDRFRAALAADPRTRDQARELLEDVVDVYSRDEGSAFFATATFEFGGKVSLSWFLTREERELILKEASSDKIDDRIRRIALWWRSRPLNRPLGQ